MTHGESLKDTNLKSAVCAMVERLDDGVRRLERPPNRALTVAASWNWCVRRDTGSWNIMDPSPQKVARNK